MSGYRIGKKNVNVAKRSTGTRGMFPDTPVVKAAIGYRVYCICGFSRRIKSMEIDLLRRGSSPRFKCTCGTYSYNIVDTNSVILPEVAKENRKAKVTKEMAVEILKSQLTTTKLAEKYGVSKQTVLNIFRNRHKYL